MTNNVLEVKQPLLFQNSLPGTGEITINMSARSLAEVLTGYILDKNSVALPLS
jgi:hypothetical protein